MSNTSLPVATARKQGTPLSYLLIFVFAFFIGILVAVYFVTKRANPIQLNEHGKPTNSRLLASPNSRAADEIV